MKGFDKRIVEYEYIHSIKPIQFLRLNQAIDPKKDESILDMGGGYGSVSKQLHEYCSKKGIVVRQYLLEESEVQIKRACQNLPWMKRNHFVKSSMLKTPFRAYTFNTVVIKMGLHELPKTKHLSLFKECQRILKPGGKLVIWDLALTQENQEVFQNIIREKDRLASFTLLMKNRYFCREDEILSLYHKAKFQQVQFFYAFFYQFSSKKRLDQELHGDRKKLDQLNQYIEKLIPASLKKKMGFRLTRGDAKFTVVKGIFIGRKQAK